ncbi:hypothetical protein PIB30_063782 [Stylosanthes scabra]|uniref:Uncharacterized protein n=1 Tax=Stylosanthes scabra TaxID=79078 RepID=A0ABU6RLU2_9FABA|nr:hypothetical protein [Stylosanthes scabra]
MLLVCISLTHKITDFVALITILKAWTAACNGRDTQSVIAEVAMGFALFSSGCQKSEGVVRLDFEQSRVECVKLHCDSVAPGSEAMSKNGISNCKQGDGELCVAVCSDGSGGGAVSVTVTMG